MRFYLNLTFALLMTGCVSLEHSGLKEFPQADFPENELFSLKSAEDNRSSKFSYQDVFPDPQLHSLIEKALEQNPDFQLQSAEIELVEAQSGFELAGSAPSLSGSLQFLTGKEKTRETDFKKRTLPKGNASISLGWEFDLWGKWKARRMESLHEIKAAHHLQHAARLALIYKVSELWITLKYLQEDLGLVEKQLAQHHEIHVLHLSKFHAGLDANSSLIEMETELKLLAVEHNQIQRRINTIHIRLQSALGSPLLKNSFGGLPLSESAFPLVPDILPAEALRERPDVLAGEAEVLAQFHHAQASVLDLYPSLGIKLSGVGMTGDLSKPFSQWIAHGGPFVHLPIWDPKRTGRSSTEKVRLKKLDFVWKGVILNAIEEIEVATILNQSTMNDYRVSENLVKEFEKLALLSESKYSAGLISKIELLHDKLRLTQKERSHLENRFFLWSSFFQICQALGVNWVS